MRHPPAARLRSGKRPAVEPALSGGDRRPTWCAPRWPCWITSASRPVLRDRRIDGRHAGAGMGGEPSGPRVLGCADRLRRSPFGAEHRLHEVDARRSCRSEWKGGDYRLHQTVPARGLAVARMTAHITYLSEQALQRKFGRALQDATRWVSASTPTSSRELPAPPGLDLRRPLRRQQLPLHHAGRWTISTSPTPMAVSWPTPSRARRRASA